jgi:hypothetical protein
MRKFKIKIVALSAVAAVVAANGGVLGIFIKGRYGFYW